MGALFVCQAGTINDSHRFLPDAVDRGAVAAITHTREGFETAVGMGLAAIQLPGDKIEFNKEIWRICDAFHDHPTRYMKVIGVTGTNGKTTTAWLIRDIFLATGVNAAYIGTLGFQVGKEDRPLNNTTPYSVELYNLLAEARGKGVEFLAMEVSSHALTEHRADGVEFDAAVFTNLTQDHLDFHGSMEEYERAKWRLFEDLPRLSAKKFVAAINVGDPVGARWSKNLDCLPYAVIGQEGLPDDCVLDQLRHGLAGSIDRVAVDHLELQIGPWEGDQAKLHAPLGGLYNVENVLSALAGVIACGRSVGLDFEDSPGKLAYLASRLSHVRPVPGRFEAVANDAGIGIIVDYAHTPDAIEKLLNAARPLVKGRIITVFGCGGDRDRGKRPAMARAAHAGSDLVVVTSDNPRTEDPQAIIKDVLGGIPGGSAVAIEDRAEAVAYAIGQAKEGDAVIIAGKGHENYQIIGREKVHMDDRELARGALSVR
jgi:UDP-N-acetylmuramyl-tripeptide synthetase